MRRRFERTTATAMFVSVTFLCAAGIVFGLQRTSTLQGHEGFGASGGILFLSQIGYAAIGALILFRRPGHRVGWVFLLVGLTGSIATGAQEYTRYSVLVAGDSGSVVEVTAWVGAVAGTLVPATFNLLLLLFPTGSLPSAQWRWTLWFQGAAVTSIVVFGIFLWPRRSVDMVMGGGSGPGIDNAPLEASTLVLFFVTAAAVLSLGVRFRRAETIERLQIKWLLSGAALSLVGISINVAGVEDGGYDWTAALGYLVVAAGALVVPVAAGLAILRYRLYDIDRIINRTLVYALVTAGLAAAYAAGVLALQAVLPISDDSPVVVAGTTLAVVALFRPLRERVQRFVDRYFYRSRYDAARTVDDFAERLRREVNVDRLTGDLLDTVRATVQPAHTSLWVRSDSGNFATPAEARR